MKQRTLSKEYVFEGKGLHTGKYAHASVGPAPAQTGIRFVRTDIGEDAFVDALAENVRSTARSTEIAYGKASVRTVEHILSALTGLGVDNAIIRIDSEEMPILDGSAGCYVEAMADDPFVEQDAERKWVTVDKEIKVENDRNGSYVIIRPLSGTSYISTIDFDSRVLGVQTARWDGSRDYVKELAPCRTFCFFHEIKTLLLLGMVKGGDLDNAIVVVEKPVSRFYLRLMARLLKQPMVTVTPEGYFSNLKLRFPDECGRHKLMDLIGDLRLSGGFLMAEVEAYKPGHRLNTMAAEAIRKQIN